MILSVPSTTELTRDVPRDTVLPGEPCEGCWLDLATWVSGCLACLPRAEGQITGAGVSVRIIGRRQWRRVPRMTGWHASY